MLNRHEALKPPLILRGTVGNFFPTILKSFGFSNTITLLITAPPYSEAGSCSGGLD